MAEERTRTTDRFERMEREAAVSGTLSPFVGFDDDFHPVHHTRANPSRFNIQDPVPDPGRLQNSQGKAPITSLRKWFPLLSDMPDFMMANSDLNTLMALNQSLQPAAPQLDPMSQAWSQKFILKLL